MEKKEYKPNLTISLLYEHKEQYQKNILFAWFIIFILTSIVCWFLITKNNSFSHIENDLIISSSMGNKRYIENIPKPKGSSEGSFAKSEGSFFHSGGKVKYKIIKESNSPFTNTIRQTVPNIYKDLEFTGLQDFKSPYSVLIYSDNDDFGLPVDSSMIDYYSNRRHFYSPYFTKINLPEKSSVACIDWVQPQWPKDGRGLYAVVSVLVSVSRNGKKECKLIKEEPPDYGFVDVLLEAINESIFWPAKDMYGKKLDGSYLITYEFCSECKENIVTVVSGDVVIKPRRNY